MNKLFALVLLPCAALSNVAFANDYVAVKVEAENFNQKNSLWREFSNSSQPNVNPDPDGSHHGTASGGSYLELLPDTRVTHGDPLRTGNNFWPNGGEGPAISYTVNFPEAGRYTVWVKAYSTGTEDNGIHVGINGTNPASGERMQWCSGKNNWTWSSAQRTNSNHCGSPRTVTLDVPFAGANTITFTAREDGFELDQFIFIKENVAGLQCAPANNDNVSCNRSASGSTSNQNSAPAAPAPDPTPAPVTVEPEPEPEPVQQEEPEETMVQVQSGSEETAANETTSTGAVSHPACELTTSDTDGDGYGWENGKTCIATTSPGTAPASQSVLGVPVCVSTSSDPDGDGWGWENNQTCLVEGSDVMQSLETSGAGTNTQPYCDSASSDPDGDGWGWENNQSCVVR